MFYQVHVSLKNLFVFSMFSWPFSEPTEPTEWPYWFMALVATLAILAVVAFLSVVFSYKGNAKVASAACGGVCGAFTVFGSFVCTVCNVAANAFMHLVQWMQSHIRVSGIMLTALMWCVVYVCFPHFPSFTPHQVLLMGLGFFVVVLVFMATYPEWKWQHCFHLLVGMCVFILLLKLARDLKTCPAHGKVGPPAQVTGFLQHTIPNHCSPEERLQYEHVKDRCLPQCLETAQTIRWVGTVWRYDQSYCYDRNGRASAAFMCLVTKSTSRHPSNDTALDRCIQAEWNRCSYFHIIVQCVVLGIMLFCCTQI